MPTAPPPASVAILVHPDICNGDLVAQAIRDADVVISTIGPTFAERHNARTALLSPPDLHCRLAQALIGAMQEAGTPTKVIAVSTASMGPADALMPLGPRLLLGFLRTVIVRNLRVIGRDLTAMEQKLATSGLDWYAVRPVKLTDGPLTEQVQAGERFVLRSISRADVAWYLLTLAEATSPPPTRTPILISAPHRRRVRTQPLGTVDTNRTALLQEHDVVTR